MGVSRGINQIYEEWGQKNDTMIWPRTGELGCHQDSPSPNPHGRCLHSPSKVLWPSSEGWTMPTALSALAFSYSTPHRAGAQYTSVGEKTEWMNMVMSQSGVWNLNSHLLISPLLPPLVLPISPSSFSALLRAPGMASLLASLTVAYLRARSPHSSVCHQLPRL